MKANTAWWVVVIGLVSALQVQGDIIAQFTDGNGTTSVDQYKGIAGDNWTSAWDDVGTVGGTGVTSTSPLNGGGNYLAISGIDNGEGVSRRYGNFDAVDITQDQHVVSWDLRVDAGGVFRAQVVSRNNNILNTSGDVHWWLDARGASPNFMWTTHDYTTGSDVLVASTVTAVQGNVYHFDVTVDPANDLFQVHLYDVGDPGGAWTSAWLGTRNVSPGTESYLAFGKQTGGQPTGISIDSIRIAGLSVIPEPSSLALLGLAAVMVRLVRRRAA